MSTIVGTNIEVTNLKYDSDTTSMIISNTGQVTVQGEGSATTNLQQGLVKAWLQHNSSHAIQDSFNFSSITDGGTGLTNDATFTSAMANDDYSVSGIVGGATNDDAFWANLVLATTDFNARCRTHNGNLNDANRACLTVHGDLA